MFMSSDLSVELPYYIQEQYSPEELESRYLHEPYDSEGENNTENSGASNSPKYGFFTICSLEFFGCHTDEDSIVSAHHEVDHDDIQ